MQPRNDETAITRPFIDARAACETGRQRGPRRLRTALTGAAALLATTALGGLVLAQVSVAQSVEWEDAEWEGTESDDWFEGNNWEGGAVPELSDPVLIDTDDPNPTVIDTDTANSHSIRIGISDSNTGNLTIQNGGQLNTGSGYIGYDSGSEGTATVTGEGARWDPEGNLYVGYRGQGTLNIEDGGAVDTGQEVGIGVYTGSESTATVTGEGARWDIEGNLYVGNYGHGTLNIEDGGTVVAGGGTVDAGGNIISIGRLPGSEGTATVTGEGARWGIGGNLYVGQEGRGTLAIEDGGAVDTGNIGYIGSISGSEGKATVTGEGSVWSIEQTLLVGNEGTGTLTIAEDGTVAADNAVAIAYNSTATGRLIIGSESGEAPTGAGMLDTAAVNFGDGDATLMFNHSDEDYLFAPALASDGTGTHAIDHLSGTTLLTGDSSGFDGTTNVSGGRLLVGDASGSGRLGGSIDVAGGAVLGGSGTVGSTTVASGGTVSPGSSIGELTVDGDLTFSSGSFLDIEVAPAGTTGDHVQVNGTASLAGTVRYRGLDGEYDPESSYTILTADDGLDGTFDAAESDYTFLDTNLSYSSNSVALELTRNDVDFSDMGRSGNQKGTGAAIESLGPGNPLYDAIVTYVGDPQKLQEILAQLSGDSHASSQTAMSQVTQMIGSFVRAHSRGQVFGGTQLSRSPRDNQYATLGSTGTRDQASGARQALNSRAWGRAFGTWGKNDGDDNAPGNEYLTGGFLMGLDTNLDGWTLGGFAGYSRSDIDSDRAGAGSDVDSYYAGVYGGRTFDVGGPGTLGLNLGAGFTWHETEARRRVNLPGDTQNLSADYSAQSYQLFSELGYRMEGDQGALEPYAGLSYLRQHTEGYEEDGGSAALIRESSTRNTYYATLGLRGETSFDLDDDRALTLRGGLGWRHAFGDVTPTVEQRFAGGESFSISGAPIDRDAAILETGLDLELSETTTLSLDYDGQLSPNAQEHTGRLQLSIRF